SSNSAGSVSTFQNNGAFVQRGPGTASFSHDVTFNNAGTVDVEQGTMSLYGSGTHTGSFHLANGAKLELRWTQNFTASSQITGPGTLIVHGQTMFDGQLSPTGTVALGSFAFNLSSTTSTGVLELSDGRLNGLDDSALTVNEEMNWQGGTL